jgi:hypothetical protein
MPAPKFARSFLQLAEELGRRESGGVMRGDLAQRVYEDLSFICQLAQNQV